MLVVLLRSMKRMAWLWGKPPLQDSLQRKRQKRKKMSKQRTHELFCRHRSRQTLSESCRSIFKQVISNQKLLLSKRRRHDRRLTHPRKASYFPRIDVNYKSTLKPLKDEDYPVAAIERFGKAIEALIERFPGDNCIVVTHAAGVVAMVSFLLRCKMRCDVYMMYIWCIYVCVLYIFFWYHIA